MWQGQQELWVSDDQVGCTHTVAVILCSFYTTALQIPISNQLMWQYQLNIYILPSESDTTQGADSEPGGYTKHKKRLSRKL